MSAYRIRSINAIKPIAAIVALCFFMQEAAAAAPVIAAALPMSELIRRPAQIDIPFNAVTLQEVHVGTSGKLIIHIQDAHANLSGQQSLAKAVEHFVAKYGIKIVLVEGADRDVTLDSVRKLAPLSEWQIIARRFLYEGMISGEEYLNLTTEYPIKLRGIEYQDLYDEAVKTYAALVDRRKDILHYLYQAKVSLDRLKGRMYPSELLEYERSKGSDDLDNGAGFAEALKALFALAEGAGVGLQEYPALEQLKMTMDRERSVDFDRANREQTQILGSLDGDAAREFADASRRLRNSQVSQYRLTRQLLEHAEERGLAAQDFPELAAYAEYLERFLDLRMEQVMTEQERFEDSVFDELLPDDDARKVRAIDRFLGLLGNAYKLQMSSHNFKMYEFNERDFPTESWLAFMNRRLADLGFFESMVPTRNHLEEAHTDFKKFYRLVSDRDNAFAENAKKIMAEESADAAILVAGGYHTEHLTELLRAANVSYLVLTPLVTDATDHEKYEETLLRHLKEQQQKLSSGSENGLFSAENVVSTKIPRGLRPRAWAASGGRMSASVEKFIDKRLIGPASGARISEGIQNIFASLLARSANLRAGEEEAIPATDAIPEPSINRGVAVSGARLTQAQSSYVPTTEPNRFPQLALFVDKNLSEGGRVLLFGAGVMEEGRYAQGDPIPSPQVVEISAVMMEKSSSSLHVVDGNTAFGQGDEGIRLAYPAAAVDASPIKDKLQFILGPDSGSAYRSVRPNVVPTQYTRTDFRDFFKTIPRTGDKPTYQIIIATYALSYLFLNMKFGREEARDWLADLLDSLLNGGSFVLDGVTVNAILAMTGYKDSISYLANLFEDIDKTARYNITRLPAPRAATNSESLYVINKRLKIAPAVKPAESGVVTDLASGARMAEQLSGSSEGGLLWRLLKNGLGFGAVEKGEPSADLIRTLSRIPGMMGSRFAVEEKMGVDRRPAATSFVLERQPRTVLADADQAEAFVGSDALVEENIRAVGESIGRSGPLMAGLGKMAGSGNPMLRMAIGWLCRNQDTRIPVLIEIGGELARELSGLNESDRAAFNRYLKALLPGNIYVDIDGFEAGDTGAAAPEGAVKAVLAGSADANTFFKTGAAAAVVENGRLNPVSLLILSGIARANSIADRQSLAERPFLQNFIAGLKQMGAVLVGKMHRFDGSREALKIIQSAPFISLDGTDDLIEVYALAVASVVWAA